jgi:hypothetical protein
MFPSSSSEQWFETREDTAWSVLLGNIVSHSLEQKALSILVWVRLLDQVNILPFSPSSFSSRSSSSFLICSHQSQINIPTTFCLEAEWSY